MILFFCFIPRSRFLPTVNVILGEILGIQLDSSNLFKKDNLAGVTEEYMEGF